MAADPLAYTNSTAAKPFNPPHTIIRTSHAVQILGPNNQVIGLISGWNTAISRDVNPIYEINIDSSGLPYEQVPGNVKGLTIQVNRYDIWTSRMEEAFGTGDITMLQQQNKPFSVIEKWTYPTGETEMYTYHGCWFTTLGRGLRSEDNRIVQVNASLVYTWKERTQG